MQKPFVTTRSRLAPALGHGQSRLERHRLIAEQLARQLGAAEFHHLHPRHSRKGGIDFLAEQGDPVAAREGGGGDFAVDQPLSVGAVEGETDHPDIQGADVQGRFHERTPRTLR